MLRFCSMVLLSLACGLGLSSGEVTAPAQPQTEESAGFLFEGREYIVEGGQERGPWLYESERITVLINRVSWRGRQCYVADVRLRDGERFFSGFAHKTPPGRKAEMPYRIARRYEAVLGLTADFLCHHANPKGVMIRDGEVYFDGASADMLAVFDDSSMDVFRAGSVDAGGSWGWARGTCSRSGRYSLRTAKSTRKSTAILFVRETTVPESALLSRGT